MKLGAYLVTMMLAAGLSGPMVRTAQAVEAPFETRLIRLAEILGSLHYLRNLCGEQSNQWRDEMETLLATENPEPATRARYVSGFNNGYRSFGSAYNSCTQSAQLAAERYRKEGEALARDIAVRYGN